MTRLLAKTVPQGYSEENPPYSCLLPGHLEQVADVAEVLLDLTSPVMTSHFPWPEPLFRLSVRLAALTHDLGKISKELFQPLVHGTKAWRQCIRHEIISDWLLQNHPQLHKMMDDLLAGYREKERLLSLRSIRLAVLGHHFKFDLGTIESSERIPFLDLSFEHPDMLAVLDLFERRLGIHLPQLASIRLSLDEDDVEENIREPLKEWLDRADREMSLDEKRWMASVRSVLIAADMIGSIRADTPEEWRSKLRVLKEAVVQADVSPVLDQVLEAAKKRNPHRHPEITSFQEHVRQAALNHDIVLIESGCGTGKTQASFGWGSMTGARYMLIGYPTTATVTQGYADHMELFGNNAQLLHSRSDVDLDLLLKGGWTDNIPEDRDHSIEELREESLQRLVHPMTFCTVDTIIGLLHNYRSSYLLFPIFVNGCIVFDEAHAYDEKLWQGVLDWLKLFPMPVLIMTASLQPHRKKELIDVCSGVRSLTVQQGPPTIQSLPKYNVHLIEEGQPPLEKIVKELVGGHSVLVVLNTVERARETYDKLAVLMPDGADLLLYHSHFKYEDRVRRQENVVERTRKGGGVCIVCTPICEMSFDISVTRLFSEIAPFPSLIQRLGRLLRYLRDTDQLESKMDGNAYFWMPVTYGPYRNWDELLESEQLLRGLPRPCSQLALNERLGLMRTDGTRRREEPDWLRIERFKAESSAREAQQTTVEVILASDAAQIMKEYGTSNRLEWMKKVLPLSRSGLSRLDETVKKWRHVRIVDDQRVNYEAMKGGEWA
ncbi:putative CRISPR-associated nuclease/helicase Cas3 [Paenibacillus sp. 32O-W]|uniref:CRISPR-associated helicase/endonuclease Cas3 n=1 Tax=Paenibacillus sp. 32O-W TaxID=1695218 RepID=UPI000721AECC|nr:CRISPR-associated helicase/endonuclease Cas3 [Paenibacillus sp. 32O-W]ALS30100.1 putative CRISPR-associated nuclease/helicase Cas3 [Paenibacillus sp. 32O-W]